MKLLTVEEAAPLFHVHKKTLSKWCLERRVPAKKFGRRWLINPDVIEKIMSEGYSVDNNEVIKCQSSSVAKRTISASKPMDKAYTNLLKRKTK